MSIDALTRIEAERMAAWLRGPDETPPDASEHAEGRPEQADRVGTGREVVRLSSGRLALAGLTGRRLAVPFVVAGWLMQQFSNRVFDDDSASRITALADRTLGELLAFGLGAVALWLGAAALWSVVADHGLVIAIEGSRLTSERGLLNRRREELEIERVQVVRVERPVIRRLTGTGDLVVRVAGVVASDGAAGTIGCRCCAPLNSSRSSMRSAWTTNR